MSDSKKKSVRAKNNLTEKNVGNYLFIFIMMQVCGKALNKAEFLWVSSQNSMWPVKQPSAHFQHGILQTDCTSAEQRIQMMYFDYPF